jgi:CO dehydrogenase maturation factor
MCDTCEAHRHHHHEHDHAHGHVHAHEHGHGDLGGFRVVVAGKGGVGKTSLTALIARLLARQGQRVLALDADPQMNLPYALGLPYEQARALVPLSRNRDYVEEKTGASSDSGWGLFFRLNPDAKDAVERFGVVGPDGVQLMVMGTTVQPAAGCLCPENTLLAGVVEAVSLRRGEAILMDTQAGVEHFGRALAKGFHHALVVTDPTFNGMQVALHAARLAQGLGIPAVHLAINRVREPAELERSQARLAAEGGFPFVSSHALPYDEGVLAAEPGVDPILERADSPFMQSVQKLISALLTREEALSPCVS